MLHERGYQDTHCFDIVGLGDEQRDFFDITERYASIVTNPPFSRHVEFIEHAKQIATEKVALLLPLNYLTGKQRHSRLWEDQSFPLARVLILNRGVNFLTDDPFADRTQSSQLYCASFIFERAHEGPPSMQWLDNHVMVKRRGCAPCG